MTKIQKTIFKLTILILFPIVTLASSHIRTIDVYSICNTKTSTIRNVSEIVKKVVYKRDGVIFTSGSGLYEVDHRVALTDGGSNDITNLMIQPFFGKCNAHDKDKLEVKLHTLICKGKIDVIFAQELLYNNWIKGYKLYVDPKGCN